MKPEGCKFKWHIWLLFTLNLFLKGFIWNLNLHMCKLILLLYSIEVFLSCIFNTTCKKQTIKNLFRSVRFPAALVFATTLPNRQRWCCVAALLHGNTICRWWGGAPFSMLSRLSTDPEGCESVLWSFPLRSLPRPGNNSAAPLITLVHYCYCIIVTASPRARGGSRKGKEPHSSDWRRRCNERKRGREAKRLWPDWETREKKSEQLERRRAAARRQQRQTVIHGGEKCKTWPTLIFIGKNNPLPDITEPFYIVASTVIWNKTAFQNKNFKL